MATAPAFGTFDVNNIASVMAGMSQQSKPEVNSEPTVEPPLSLFKSIAVPMIGRSVPVIPLHPRTKIAFKTNWTELASTDPVWIDMWNMENPDYNGAACAFARLDGTWFLDADDPSIWKRIENETGKTIPVTFKVCSSGEKRHLYFHQTAASIAMGNQGGKDADGKESWSARINNRYVVAANSIHPDTGEAYTVADDSPILEAPDWLVEWLRDNAHDSAKNNPNGVRVNASPDGPPIPRGRHDNELFRIACMLRGAGMDREQILDNLIQICEKRCTDHGSDYVEMCERKTDQAIKYPVTPAPSIATIGGKTSQELREEEAERAKEKAEREAAKLRSIQEEGDKRKQDARDQQQATRDQSVAAEPDEDEIPAFDESCITGIYRDIVDLAVKGTTIPPQFALLNAKVYFGALLAGKVTFEGLDSDSSYYGTVIGETGTSKGESWRRTFETILHPAFLNLSQSLKVIYSADSGAGLKDVFFEPPDVSVVDYVDEVGSLGHKGGEKKQPEIIDTIVELADSNRVSRVLAKKGKSGGSKTHDNARLSLYMCGQDGSTFMSAFAGRTKMGLFDRFYPEYSGPIEAGDLPEISQSDVISLHAKINSTLKFTGKMTMSGATKLEFDIFWSAQPVEIRRKIRFRKHLMLDLYMAAFGRGVTVAEPEDLAAAIKMFKRQIIIRRVHFTGEVPDRVGYYHGQLQKLTERMHKKLLRGVPVEEVAMTKRDFLNMSHSFRDREEHVFERAWQTFHKNWLWAVSIAKANGQRYEKLVPIEADGETWLSTWLTLQ